MRQYIDTKTFSYFLVFKEQKIYKLYADKKLQG